jgi:hypothetical protein
MTFQPLYIKTEGQALDMLVIAFLLLFTIMMFMQFGVPSLKSAYAGNQVKISHGSFYDQ